MSVVTLTELKTYFETGDFPTQQQFINLIDTLGGGSTGNGNLLAATLELTSAQILQLNSTPIDIVAAPGVGKYIEVVSASSSITFNSAAYTTNTALLLSNTGADRWQLLDNDILLSTTSKRTKFKDGSSVAAAQTQIISNTALQVKVATGNPAAGNSAIKVFVLYRIVTE